MAHHKSFRFQNLHISFLLAFDFSSKIGMDYRKATNNLSQDHAQGVSKQTQNPKFGTMEIEVVSRQERQRVSDKLRAALDLPKVKVAANNASYVMNR